MSFPRYPKYKASGVEWLGDVPEGWAVWKMSQLFRAGKGKNGQMLTKEFCGVNEGDYPVYSGQTENEGVMGTWDQFEFDFGEAGVLFSTTVGAKAMHLRQLFGRFSLSQNCMIIWSTSGCCITRFFYYHFQPLFQRQRSMIPDHMQPSFRMEDLYGCMIALPPLPEQVAIAEFLDRETGKIDELVAEQRRLMELLKEKRQAVISHAVTKGLNPHAPMKPSGIEWLGDVPEHWTLPKLKSVATFSGGGTPSRDNPAYWNGDIPWVSPKDMKVERITGAEESITEEGLRSSASNLLPLGRILIVVRSGILKHTIPIAVNETAVALNQDMKALFFDAGKCLGSFFFRWVQGHNDQLLFAWSKQGATVESIEHSYLAQTVVPLPGICEQAAIVSFLDTELSKFDALTAEAQRTIDLLQERRTALISAAVTGQIDVRQQTKN